MQRRFENRQRKDVSQMRIEGSGTGVFFSTSKPTDINPVDTPFDMRSSYIRQTYHILEFQKKAIALMSAHEGLDKSEIVRKAIDSFIPKTYIQMALIESSATDSK